jgi:hypothetical protein
LLHFLLRKSGRKKKWLKLFIEPKFSRVISKTSLELPDFTKVQLRNPRPLFSRPGAELFSSSFECDTREVRSS